MTVPIDKTLGNKWRICGGNRKWPNLKYCLGIELYGLRKTKRGKKTDWGTLVPRINVENGIKLGFLLECNLYIKIEILLKHYYMYSTLFIEITQSV
jgi:hypothetical protein